MRLASVLATVPYYRTANRVRVWGRLPFRRGPTIVVANHQHDLDSPVLTGWFDFCGPWRDPVFAVAGRRMFEPGFLAPQFPWLAPALRRVNLSPLFRALGLVPIENELASRAISSFAWIVRERYGNLAMREVFEQSALDRSGLGDARLADVLSAGNFRAGRTYVKVREVREPYRSEIARQTRARVDADLAQIEELVRGGATFHLTAEGRFTPDGRLGRFRHAFFRLAPLADVYLSAVSYDPFRSTRLPMLVRIVGPVGASDARLRLAAARPVVVSQLLGEYLLPAPPSFGRDEVAASVAAGVRALPHTLFVDPDLAHDPERVVDEALRTLVRLRILRRDGDGYRLGERRSHPRFPLAADMIAFQAAFFSETLDADRRLRGGAPPDGGGKTPGTEIVTSA